MVDKAKVAEAVLSAVEQLNEELPERLEPAPETVLFGRGSALDSLGLVNLIVGVEQNLADEFDVEITLADDKAMSQASSPFRSVETLTEYVVHRLEEVSDG